MSVQRSHGYLWREIDAWDLWTLMDASYVVQKMKIKGFIFGFLQKCVDNYKQSIFALAQKKAKEKNWEDFLARPHDTMAARQLANVLRKVNPEDLTSERLFANIRVADALTHFCDHILAQECDH